LSQNEYEIVVRGINKPRRKKAYASEIETYNELAKLIQAPGEHVIPGKDGMKISPREKRKRERLRKKAARDKEEKTVRAALARARAQKAYYEKNKERLNRERILRSRQPEYVYKRAKDRAKKNGHEWEFDFETWTGVWNNTRPVPCPESGFMVTAWSKRGSDHSRDAQMKRKDLDGPWSPENCYISYCGESVSKHE